MECCMCCTLFYAIGAFILYKILDYIIRIPKIGQLRDRYVLVTGADTGFGHEISRRLDAMGCNVFAGCLTEKGEDELRKNCSARLKPVHLDVSKHASVLEAYDQVKKMIPHGKGLWGIYNNAGVSGKSGPAEWLHLKDYQQVLDVNLLGLVDVTMTFLPLVKKAKGRIINTASVFGRTTIVGTPAYCMSKYGVESFSDTMRRQLHGYGVSVHIIEPGFHKTHMTQGIVETLKRAWAEAPQEAKEEFGEEFLDQSIKNVLEQFIEKIVSDKTSDVVDAYEHALLGMYPRARYVVGKDAKYLWLPLQALPEWLGDWLIDQLAKDKPIPRVLKQK